jgi:hypothetical protein
MSISIVKINDKPNSADLMEYIMDSVSDVYSLPTDCADGSIAYTANLKYIYILKNGAWTQAGE